MSTTPIVYTEDLVPGARNAIRSCLRVQPDEHVTVITDRETEDIAASLVDQVLEVGASCELHVLEDYGGRPMVAMPAPILEALERSQVSIFAAQPQTGELPSRIQMTDVVNRRKMRHAHMVYISHRIMMEGMRADFGEVDAISTRVLERAKKAKTIRARSAAGSNLEATFSPDIRWLKTSGIISPEKWANLPAGEVLTSPARRRRVRRGRDSWRLSLGPVRGSRDDAPHRHDREQPSRRRPMLATRRPPRFPSLHEPGRKLESGRRVRSRNQHRGPIGDRQHPAGREAPRPPHRVRSPV